MKYVVEKIKKFRSSENISCLLGKESTFEGIIKFNGNARIDGQFKGELFGVIPSLLVKMQ